MKTVAREHHMSILTTEQEQEIVNLYKGGEEIRTIALMVHLGHKRIIEVLDAHNIERRVTRGSRVEISRKQELLDRYVTGESIANLLADFGTSNATIFKTLKKMGANMRFAKGERDISAAQVDIIRAGVIANEPIYIIAKVAGMHGDTVKREIGRMGLSDAYFSDESRNERAKRRGAPGVKRLNVNRSHLKGEHAPAWRGGRIVSDGGYVKVRPADDENPAMLPMQDSRGYILEHRLVMARNLGRSLEAHESVHHINGDPSDNRLENLQLRSGKHGTGVIHECLDCGSRNIKTIEIG